MQHSLGSGATPGAQRLQTPRTLRQYASQFAAIAGVTLLIGATGMSGCASAPKSSEGIRAAEVAIARAEQARVADYTSPELIDARAKLAASRSELAAKHEVQAERLAAQARLSAELAVAKSQAAKAEAVNAATRTSTEVLKQEMQRQNGATQ